jgi:hypothetical protein
LSTTLLQHNLKVQEREVQKKLPLEMTLTAQSAYNYQNLLTSSSGVFLVLQRALFNRSVDVFIFFATETGN